MDQWKVLISVAGWKWLVGVLLLCLHVVLLAHLKQNNFSSLFYLLSFVPCCWSGIVKTDASVCSLSISAQEEQTLVDGNLCSWKRRSYQV